MRFNRKTGETRHIIVRRGWFFPVNAWLPTRALSINQGITTSLSRAEVQAVIEAGPPRAGNEVVRDAEWRLLFKRWQEMPAGRVTIGYGAGRLQLEGEMHDAVDALTVEQLVRGVHGVIGVDNRISIKQKQPRMGLAIDSAMATVPTQPLAA